MMGINQNKTKPNKFLNNDTERTREDSALERGNARKLTINIKNFFNNIGVVESFHVLGVVLLEGDN